MKPSSTLAKGRDASPRRPPPSRINQVADPILAFGAHPDDVEFGCGAILAKETAAGRPVHIVVCSRGESASAGTPAKRAAEARRGAAALGATVEFIHLDGDARLEPKPKHARKLAAIIRRFRPEAILAPTPIENQHPDHPRLGALVRVAARLARYGGIAELKARPAHSIGQLFYYAVTVEAEPFGTLPILIDVSQAQVLAAWEAAMKAHATQAASRPYVELQLARSKAFGLRAGVAYAMALFPNDPLIFSSLAAAGRGARRF
jgi:LmbE family N-acetylglucosaminyl deacetylase